MCLGVPTCVCLVCPLQNACVMTACHFFSFSRERASVWSRLEKAGWGWVARKRGRSVARCVRWRCLPSCDHPREGWTAVVERRGEGGGSPRLVFFFVSHVDDGCLYSHDCAALSCSLIAFQRTAASFRDTFFVRLDSRVGSTTWCAAYLRRFVPAG